MVDDGKFRRLLIWYKFLEHLPLALLQDGRLNVPGIDIGLQSIFLQYMGEDPSIAPVPGAFGKNAVIAEYLRKHVV